MTKFGNSSMPGWVKPAVIVIALGAVAVVAAPFIKRLISPPPAAKPALVNSAGAFKATDGQWATLSFYKVENRLFRREYDTDGKIAVDDDRTTPVFSPFSGRVTKLIAHVGDTVKKGDPLLLIDASEFVQAQNDLVAASGTLAAAKTDFEVTRAAEQRQHDLYESKGAALKDWQQSQVDLATAKAAYDAAQVGLAATRNRLRILGVAESEIAALEANSAPLKMTAEIAVSAPIAGTVMMRQVGPGQYINSAATSGTQIFTIGDLSALWLIANLREADTPFVHKGDDVEVSVLAYPGRKFRGKVAYVAAAIDPVTRRLAVRADIANEDGALKPEMFANFRVIGGEAGATSPAVPEAAVIYEGDKARLWVANEAEKTLALRSVTVGRVGDGFVEITDGLKTGETVVTKGALFIDRAAKVN